jgi:hypothetical protein
MNEESPQALIQEQVRDLRSRFPRIGRLGTALEAWREGDAPRYSLALDIRWPEHQTLVAGPARPSAEEAVRAAFEAARERLEASYLEAA